VTHDTKALSVSFKFNSLDISNKNKGILHSGSRKSKLQRSATSGTYLKNTSCSQQASSSKQQESAAALQ